MSRRLIRIVTPEPPESARGNRVTAERWAAILRDLGYEVIVEESLGGHADALVALHARRSAESVRRFVKDSGGLLIVALTGTDLYGDLAEGDETALRSARDASRLIVLQARGADALPPDLRDKVRVIHQSTAAPNPMPERAEPFRVCVVGHMRPVKDPFRAAEASRQLAAESPVRVVHIGSAPDDAVAEQARQHQRDNSRYEWLGPMSREQTLVEIARSQLLCLTSLMEGGANVVTEALACDTPVVSSRIDGSLGLLGEDYPGYFPPGDTDALAALLATVSTQPGAYADLAARCGARAHLADPATEREAWRSLLNELSFS